MRLLLVVIQFELRYQLRSPFFLGALLLFALVHFLAFTGVINLDVGQLVAINSPYALLQTELLFFILGMLPIVAFVTNASTRDFEHATAALVFATPISPRTFVLGRWLGALSCASLIGLAGLLGSLLGTLMPWLEPTRIQPFSVRPWVYIFFVVLLPNTIVLCALFFSVAALTRSVALTWAAAMTFFVADLLLNLAASPDHSPWLALVDPSGRLAVAAETRYWTATELNAQLPWGWLLQNRLFWLGGALVVLGATVWRFRLDLERETVLHHRDTEIPQGITEKARGFSSYVASSLTFLCVSLCQLCVSVVKKALPPKPAYFSQGFVAFQTPAQRFFLREFVAQLKMDLACVGKSPLLYIILILGIVSVLGEVQGQTSLLQTPLYPLTSLLLPALRFGLLQFVLLIGLWYSAELLHRERAARLHEIIHASPLPGWVPLLSKTATICLIVNALLFVVVLAAMTRQAAAGRTNFELSLYLRSAFVYNGIYYCMLCVLAVVIQTLVRNKWLGLLLTLGVYIGLLSLEPMGFNHPLYGFAVPAVPYSDMNGYGHFAPPAHWLIAYWGAFCVLLLIVGHLFYPRGNAASWRERWREARLRGGGEVKVLASLATLAFVSIGGWIFYNTNVRNEYLSPRAQLQRRAEYEKNWGRYETAPMPSYDRIEMALDIFPAERRMESRGTATLGNHKQVPITEFIMSVNPVLRVNQLAVENTTLAQSDPAQGVYLFRCNLPLAPGATVKMTWNVTRRNEGFVAAEPDNGLVANGTYLDMIDVLPIPGYNESRRLTDNAERRQHGLPPAPRTPKLDDPAYADKIGFGIDSRTTFEVVLSTSADQIAVAPGRLRKEWQQEGRRYFHYQAEQPILPNLSFCSARYAVARDRWNDVALEIYYDPKHTFNIAAMMESAKRGLAMYSAEFAPYQYSYLRILEYPNYRSAGKFHSGTLPLAEGTGFVNDLRAVENLDYGVLHELAHLWWGERITGAQVQGRWLLTENLADYSALMLLRETSPALANRVVSNMLEAYLKGRRDEDEAEVPVMYTERHGYLRAKGPHVLYALQNLIGKDKVHRALRTFLQRYSFQTSPCPTAKDLVTALRAEAGPEYQQLVTDWFERIVLYDLQVDAAHVREVDGSYEVTVEVTAKQFAADGSGNETEEPLAAWFDVAVFAELDKPLAEMTPLYIAKHRLHSGKQSLILRTSQRPGLVALDPFHHLVERSAGNNRLRTALLPLDDARLLR